MYKIGKNETVVEKLGIYNKVLFIITQYKDEPIYTIYSVDNEGHTKKMHKGDNPLLLEDKVKYSKLCNEMENVISDKNS